MTLATTKTWMNDRITAAQVNLIDAVPDYHGVVVNRIPAISAQLNSNLDTLEAASLNTKAGILINIIQTLEGLYNSVELAILNNINKLEQLQLEGDIKKAIAVLRGTFKNDLAVLQGQNDVDFTLLEADKNLEQAQALMPIERSGKIALAQAKGDSDLKIAQLEHTVDVQLAGIQGQNRVAIAGIDADITLAEAEITKLSVQNDNVIDVLGIIREAITDASYTLQTAALESGLKGVEANTEVAYIGRVNSAEINSINTNAAIEQTGILTSASQEAGFIEAMGGLNVDSITSIANAEVAARTNEITLGTAIEIEGLNSESNLKISDINNSALIDANAISSDAILESNFTALDASAQAKSLTDESNAEIRVNNVQSQIEQLNTLANSLLEIQGFRALTDQQIAHDNALYSVEQFSKINDAATAIVANINKADIEAEVIRELNDSDSTHKSSIAALELSKTKIADSIKIEGSKAESRLQIQGITNLGDLKIATLGKEKLLNIQAGHDKSALNITTDNTETTNKIANSTEIQDIKKNALTAQTNLNNLQRGIEAAFSVNYTQQVADASYNSVHLAADAAYDQGIEITKDQIVVAAQITDYAISSDIIRQQNKAAAAAAIAQAGQSREHINYKFEDSSAAGIVINGVSTPALSSPTGSPAFDDIDTNPVTINTDPNITISDKINFE